MYPYKPITNDHYSFKALNQTYLVPDKVIIAEVEKTIHPPVVDDLDACSGDTGGPLKGR